MRKRKVRLLAAACGAALALSAAPAGARPAAPSAAASAALPAAAEAAVTAAPAALIPCDVSWGNHPFHPVIALGMVGNDVREIQCRVNRWQTADPKPCCGGDGVYGPATRDRILAIQIWCRAATGRRDIAMDGVVGPVTWRLLHAFSCYG